MPATSLIVTSQLAESASHSSHPCRSTGTQFGSLPPALNEVRRSQVNETRALEDPSHVSRRQVRGSPIGDLLANFGKRIVGITDDDEIPATVIPSLIETWGEPQPMARSQCPSSTLCSRSNTPRRLNLRPSHSRGESVSSRMVAYRLRSAIPSSCSPREGVEGFR